MGITIDKILGDALLHDHKSEDITDLTTTLDPRYVNVTGDTMTGALVITPSANGTSILNVTNQAGTSVLNVDTTNQRVGVGNTAPSAKLHLTRDDTSTILFRLESTAGTAHPFTTYVTEYVTGDIATARSLEGGLNFRGFSSATSVMDAGAVKFTGYRNQESTSAPVIEFQAWRSDGSTGRTTLSNTGVLAMFENGTDEKVTILGNGYIGIMTTSPQGALHINGTANDEQLIVEAHSTQTANLVEFRNSSGGVRAYITGLGRIATETTSRPETISDLGDRLYVGVDETSAGITSYVRGAYMYSNWTSSNTFTGIIGLNAVAYRTGTGASFSTTKYGNMIAGRYAVRNLNATGTVATATGISAYVENGGVGGVVAGTITTAYGILSEGNEAGSGTIVNSYGLYIKDAVKESGSITNNYGIYIDSIDDGATLNYAILTNAGNIVFNEGGDASTDFRVEGDTDQNLLFTDASADKIGIGTSTPSEKIHVIGNYQLSDAATPTKSYRFRTTGSGLDFDGAGQSIYLSVYDNADFTGTQRQYMIFGHLYDYVTCFRNWEWKDSSSNVQAQINPNGGFVFNEGGTGNLDFRVESDTEANMLFLDANADTDGAIYLGGTTNGIKISKGGDLSLLGTATVWDDLRIEPVVRSTGVKSPSFVNWFGGLFVYEFDDAVVASEKEVFFTVQMPHGWKEGSAVEPHIHWVNKSTGTAGHVVRWGLEYTKAKIGSTFSSTPTTVYGTTIAGGGDITVQYEHMLTDFDPIVMTGDTLSTILICRLFRNSSNAADTYTGIAGLLYIDWHYEIDAMGSRTELAK